MQINKKILASLAVIAVVATGVVGGTIAYFSDVEKSTGNVIVTGSIDLKVDHTLQTYNGMDCKTCNVEIASDTNNAVIATVGGADPVAFPHAAVAVSNPHVAWTVAIPGAQWIWATNPTLQADTTQDVYYTFQRKFEWLGPISGATLALGLGADNGYEVKLNGNVIGTDWTEFNYQSPADTFNTFGGSIVQGENVLEIKVKNIGQPQGTPASNPAGLLYKLTINGNCGDDYFKTHCQLWTGSNLTNQKFFNFDDVKPGDWGTDVISLNVHNNPAWVCMSVNKTSTSDEAISNGINVVLWGENGTANGIQDAGETQLYAGTLSGLLNQGLYDAGLSSLGQLPADITKYIGMKWCAGTFNGDGSCNAAVMGNEAQGDSYMADVILEAIQTRHNLGYLCSQNTGTEPDLE